MQIKEDKQGEILIVTVSEHLDTATASIFESRLLGLVDRGERQIVVDCGTLDYVNSAGLKVFLLAAKRLEPLGGKLVLCALAPSVLMIFEMIGFTRIMKIVPTREEALRVLRGDGGGGLSRASETLAPETLSRHGARRMKATLSTRLIVWVGVPAALLFAVVVWIASRRSFERVVGADGGGGAAHWRDFMRRRLDGRLSTARKIPEMHRR